MILRVFPRRTTATPTDALARVGPPDLFDPIDGVSEVHVSVAFTWDRPHAESLAEQYAALYQVVRVGGPAYGDPGGEFAPGRYLAPGNVITSRGCPHTCSRCLVPSREGALREMPITDGWRIHDNNLLACSPGHIRAVLDMLSRQSRRAVFTGGLEAARITTEIAHDLRETRADRLYTAYDRGPQIGALREAGRILAEAGFTRSHHLYCYCLCGYEGDTQDAADRRLSDAYEAGFLPYPMLFRPDSGLAAPGWASWIRHRIRPAIARAMYSSTPPWGG